MERLFNEHSSNEESSAQGLAFDWRKPLQPFRSRDRSDHVIVWDLKTVPDIAGYAAAKGLDGKSDDEVRAVMGDKFPKRKRVV